VLGCYILAPRLPQCRILINTSQSWKKPTF